MSNQVKEVPATNGADVLDVLQPVSLIIMNPPEVLELQQELARPEHAERLAQLSLLPTFEDCIAGLCTEFGILVDGPYAAVDVCRLCAILTKRLVWSRTIVVNSPEIQQ